MPVWLYVSVPVIFMSIPPSKWWTKMTGSLPTRYIGSVAEVHPVSSRIVAAALATGLMGMSFSYCSQPVNQGRNPISPYGLERVDVKARKGETGRADRLWPSRGESTTGETFEVTPAAWNSAEGGHPGKRVPGAAARSVMIQLSGERGTPQLIGSGQWRRLISRFGENPDG
ncbi:hypothetical protein GCM10009560_50530 [Nonomuraea longicatena]|uniref:Uncharacterized protein n=1 Tax=Nonomuraea longicatena TaxID=83682 RepID=A0ABN1Q9T4_9ACTN